MSFELPGSTGNYEHGTRSCYVHGCRCPECRAANTVYYHVRKDKPWNGLVSARRARNHIKRLSKVGIGSRTISDTSDVGRTTIQKVKSGEKKRIRKSTSDAILAVDQRAASDYCLVSARSTQRMLEDLGHEFLTKTRLARALGSKAKEPAIQIGKELVIAKTEHKVRRFHRWHCGEIERQ